MDPPTTLGSRDGRWTPLHTAAYQHLPPTTMPYSVSLLDILLPIHLLVLTSHQTVTMVIGKKEPKWTPGKANSNRNADGSWTSYSRTPEYKKANRAKNLAEKTEAELAAWKLRPALEKRHTTRRTARSALRVIESGREAGLECTRKRIMLRGGHDAASEVQRRL